MKTIITLLSLFMALTITKAVDFNGDGNADYVLYNSSTRQTAIWYLNSNVRIGSAYGPTLPAGWSLITEPDINGDGHPDYFLFNTSTRQTAIWYMNNNVRTGAAYGPTMPAGWIPTSVADFNGDGTPDLVLFNPATYQTAVWYMSNNGALAPIPGWNRVTGGYGPPIAAGFLLIEANADFNQDGKPDFMLWNPLTGRTAIWYLNNRTRVGAVWGPTSPASWSVDDLADFNHDGRPDYLLHSDRVTALWYLNGNILMGGAYGPTIQQGWSLPPPPCVFSVAPHSASFPVQGGSGTIYVSTLAFGCTSTRTANVPWIHITQGGGTNVGSYPVTYTVDANSGAPRTGSITIAGEQTVQTVTISQDGTGTTWDGTWAGTVAGTWTTGTGCSGAATASFTMTIITNGNAVMGSGTLNGVPCFNLADCSIDGFPNSSGTVSGSTSGQTINTSYSGTAIGGLCDGQNVGISITGTLSGTTITGTTPGGLTVTLTRQ